MKQSERYGNGLPDPLAPENQSQKVMSIVKYDAIDFKGEGKTERSPALYSPDENGRLARSGCSLEAAC
jgi:hypothetical protein